MATGIIPVPSGTFHAWANQVCISLKSSNLPNPPLQEEKWKEWARSLFQCKGLGNIPVPDRFKDWKEWGNAFIQCV